MRRVLLLGIALAFGCKTPGAKLEGIEEALASGNDTAIQAATDGFAPCAELTPTVVPRGKPGPYDAGCFAKIAEAFGSKQGFVATPPDGPALATAAVVLLRDGRGDRLTNADAWLAAIRTGKGVGSDVLRLAVARKMTATRPALARTIDAEASASEAMKAIADAIPGACPTYRLLGTNAAAKLAPELGADNAACVQHDLSRREGPGGRYGSGIFRALEGAIALFRETEQALRIGLPNVSAAARPTLERQLAIIEETTRAIVTKKLADPSASAMTALGDFHADAGVAFSRPSDAGADGAR